MTSADMNFAGAASSSPEQAPLPWEAHNGRWICDANDRHVCIAGSAEVADRIVKAANCYHELVAALRTIAAVDATEISNPEKGLRIVANLARAALSRATEA